MFVFIATFALGYLQIAPACFFKGTDYGLELGLRIVVIRGWSGDYLAGVGFCYLVNRVM